MKPAYGDGGGAALSERRERDEAKQRGNWVTRHPYTQPHIKTKCQGLLESYAGKVCVLACPVKGKREGRGTAEASGYSRPGTRQVQRQGQLS